MSWYDRDVSVVPERIQIEYYGSVGSTNLVARERLAFGADAWTVIFAEQQKSGRGQGEKSWVSPSGNMYASIILRPGTELTALSQLSFVAALAVADVVESSVLGTEVDVRLKWPNDVFLNRHKVSGILLESHSVTENLVVRYAVVVGVGINVSSNPANTRYGATCINRFAKPSKSVHEVLSGFLKAMVSWYDIWEVAGFDVVRTAWQDRSYGLGQRVRISQGNEPPVGGIFVGLDDDGRMLVRQTDDRMKTISSGSVDFSE